MATSSPQNPGESNGNSAEKSELAASQPLREDQVQNAVMFLSHPKVKGSPIIYRRSFLEKKGLTKEEIDEAFRRVPDPPTNATNASQAQALPAVQPSTSVQTLQVPSAPSALGKGVTVAQSRFYWYHAFLATGFLFASGFSTIMVFKKWIVPRMKAWVQKVVSEEDNTGAKDKNFAKLAEEAMDAAKAAVSAADVVSKASQDLLDAKAKERNIFEALMQTLDGQVKEMKTIGDALRKMESRRVDILHQDKLSDDHAMLAPNNSSVNSYWRNQQNNGHNFPSADFTARSSSVPQSKSYAEFLSAGPQEENFGRTYPVNGYTADEPQPWWKRTVKIAEADPEADGRRSERQWVPPQPPPVMMPEAAAAIRQPKPLLKQSSGDERSVASLEDGEGTRRTSGTTSENDVSISAPAALDANQNEIQEEMSDTIKVN